MSHTIIFILSWIIFSPIYAAPDAPKIPLAHVYKVGTNLKGYWLSEKFDGVRAYWDGKQLLSKKAMFITRLTGL